MKAVTAFLLLPIGVCCEQAQSGVRKGSTHFRAIWLFDFDMVVYAALIKTSLLSYYNTR